MINVIMIHKVKDFNTWKPIFDSNLQFRKDHGEISYTLYRGIEDRNLVIVSQEWESLEKVKAFTSSDDLRKRMMEAGVIGPPEIRILERVTPANISKKAA